jgi:GNAT superfamily N-acetyltransferase
LPGDAVSALQIRPATLADAEAVAGLSAQLGYRASPSVVGRRLERLVARTDHVILVALDQDRIVGWVHAAEREALEAEPRCEILGLVVDLGERRRRVGQRLVAAVETWAAGRGLAEMSVRSNLTRSESHPFYERLGYLRSKTQHVYRKALAKSGDLAHRPPMPPAPRLGR